MGNGNTFADRLTALLERRALAPSVPPAQSPVPSADASAGRVVPFPMAGWRRPGAHKQNPNNVPWKPKAEKVRCGAHARSTGKPCQRPVMPGRTRCRNHGGCSTGPRTEEGKARAREAGIRGLTRGRELQAQRRQAGEAAE